MIPSQPTKQQQMNHPQAPVPGQQSKRPPVAQQHPDAQVHAKPHPPALDEAEDELDDPVGDRSGNG